MPPKKKSSKKKAQFMAAINGEQDISPTTSGSPEPPPQPAPTPVSASEESLKSKAPSPAPEATSEPLSDSAARADAFKEEGNVAFKAKDYVKAIDLYSQAIDLRPAEPTYLTNRAASYMALNRFKLALSDCQQAASLQAASPSPKTLLRLARCQLAVGSSNPALSTIRQIIAIERQNAQAGQLQTKALDLDRHLKNFHDAKAKRSWAVARLALDKCMQTIESEGGTPPTEWRCWKIELEMARGSWDAASNAANDAFRLDSHSADILALRGLVLFLTGKLPQALQHAISALRMDPDNSRAKDLRLRVKSVERLKEEGNALFKSSQYLPAIDKYTEALEVIGEREEEGSGGQIRATLLSNRATSYLKLQDSERALADTSMSLKLSPGQYKALRTRARIYLAAEKYEMAISDFKEAIEQANMDGATADVRSLQTELKKAEVELKRSKTKDYYKILGLPKNCEDHEIKKAYRRESLKHHPDKGGDEEKFKLVAEAYAVLSDSERKARYDMGGDEDGSMSSGGDHHPFGPGMDSPFADVFAQFAGGGFTFSGGAGRQGHFAF